MSLSLQQDDEGTIELVFSIDHSCLDCACLDWGEFQDQHYVTLSRRKRPLLHSFQRLAKIGRDFLMQQR